MVSVRLLVKDPEELARVLKEKVEPELRDSEGLKNWARALEANKLDGCLEEFENAAAAFAFFSAGVSWRVTGEPEAPWRSGPALLGPKTLDEVRKLLITLADGIGEAEWKILGGVEQKTKDLIREQLDRKKKNMTSDPNQEQPMVHWEDLGVHIQYSVLVKETMLRWIRRAVYVADNLSKSLVKDESIPFFDRALGKLQTLQEGLS